MKLDTKAEVKIQFATLISRERRWYFFTILLILFTGFFSVKKAFLDSAFSSSKIGTNETRPAIGTRGLGLSQAYITSVDDATSPLWNPAGLASLNTGNLIYDLSQGSLSLAYPLKRIGTFGINIHDFNSTDRFLVNHTSNPIGTFEIGDNQVLLSYARKFGIMQLGVSTGYTRASYKNSLWTPNYDVGALMKLSPHAVIGLQFRDITGVSIRDKTGLILKTIDPELAVGTTLIPHPFIRWHSCYNVTSPGFGTSLEIVTGPLSANVGSLFSFDEQTPTQSWSLGLSFEQWGKQTYYTYLHEDNLNYKHLLSIGFTFGETPQIQERNKIDKVEPISTSSIPNKKLHTAEKPLSQRSDITETTPKIIHITPDTSKVSKPDINDVPTTPNSSEKRSVQIAYKHNISIELMLAIIYVESKFNHAAVSRTGAGGLMQLVPATARGLGLKVPVYSNKTKPSLDRAIDQRFDALKNLEAGLTYFNQLREKYHNNLNLALGAYNVGPGRVRVKGPLISRGKKYVEKVLNRRNLYQSAKPLLNNDLNRLEALLNK